MWIYDSVYFESNSLQGGQRGIAIETRDKSTKPIVADCIPTQAAVGERLGLGLQL